MDDVNVVMWIVWILKGKEREKGDESFPANCFPCPL